MDGVNGNISEIKEEVVQALENKGVLGKLKVTVTLIVLVFLIMAAPRTSVLSYPMN